MTKKQLKEGRKIRNEIEQLEREAAEVYDTAVKADGSLAYGGQTNNVSDPTAALAEKAAKLHTRLLVKRGRLIDFKEAVEAAIDGIPSTNHRQVMRAYYISGESFEKIAADMNYSIYRIWQLHGEALLMIR